MGQPYAYEIDDSPTFGPYLCKNPEFAEMQRALGRRVVDLYVSEADLAQPTRAQREDSEQAQRIVRDAAAMEALRKLRRLAGVGEGATLAGVVDVIEERLRGSV